MGTIQSTTLNTDTNDVKTSSEFGDRGDGVSRWYQWRRSADGADVTQGAKADSAVTDPAASGSVVALLKGLLSFLRVSTSGLGKAEDGAHASGDTGVMALAVRRDTAGASSGTTGDYEPLQTDATGRLRVAAVDDVTVSNATTTALAASLVAKGSAGTLRGFQGYSTADGFIQVHNASTLPADGAVPLIVIPVAADAPFSLDLGRLGRSFSTGIVICNSSTGPTKTIGGSTAWIDAQVS